MLYLILPSLLFVLLTACGGGADDDPGSGTPAPIVATTSWGGGSVTSAGGPQTRTIGFRSASVPATHPAAISGVMVVADLSPAGSCAAELEVMVDGRRLTPLPAGTTFTFAAPAGAVVSFTGTVTAKDSATCRWSASTLGYTIARP